MRDYCASCGREIPEGRQVCPICESGVNDEKPTKKVTEKVNPDIVCIGASFGHMAIIAAFAIAMYEFVYILSTDNIGNNHAFRIVLAFILSIWGGYRLGLLK